MSAQPHAAGPAALVGLEGRSALITGATGALGGAAARALAAVGARLTLTGGSGDALESLGAELRDRGAEVELVARRPDSPEDADAMAEAAVRAHGRIDLLVTASGVNKVGAIQEQDPGDWQDVMDANVPGSRARWPASGAATGSPSTRSARPSSAPT
jgi:NADP-dependent 3-hydroxy acid dehydrogenase YdfG